jgi:hypothetical protein
VETAPARWDVSRAHDAVSRVEVWSRGELVSGDAPFLGGDVTEKWVSGIRWSLSLSVEPTAEWLSWFRLPWPEIRVYSGLSWGESEYLVPMGRYPVLPPSVSLPSSAVTVTADDHFSSVISGNFAYGYPFGPGTQYAGRIRDVVALLVEQVQVAEQHVMPVLVTASSDALVTTGLYDDRSKAAFELADAIGAEVFYDRNGVPRVQDRVPTVGAPLVDGQGGTVVSIASTEDWSQVYNVVSVTSSNNDTPFYAAVVAITDPGHPAHQSKIGPRVLRYSSPLLSTQAQGVQAGMSLLAKKSAPALSWSVSCIPDARRSAGDLCLVSTDLGDFTAVLQEIKTPLVCGDSGEGIRQVMTLGAAA